MILHAEHRRPHPIPRPNLILGPHLVLGPNLVLRPYLILGPNLILGPHWLLSVVHISCGSFEYVGALCSTLQLLLLFRELGLCIVFLCVQTPIYPPTPSNINWESDSQLTALQHM